jgi:hypothetical protein
MTSFFMGSIYGCLPVLIHMLLISAKILYTKERGGSRALDQLGSGCKIIRPSMELHPFVCMSRPCLILKSFFMWLT